MGVEGLDRLTASPSRSLQVLSLEDVQAGHQNCTVKYKVTTAFSSKETPTSYPQGLRAHCK